MTISSDLFISLVLLPLFLIVASVFVLNISAKYRSDSVKCVSRLSLYNNTFYKEKSFDDANEPLANKVQL